MFPEHFRVTSSVVWLGPLSSPITRYLQVGGKPLLQRDAQGWVVVAGAELAGGTSLSGVETLPPRCVGG